VIFSRTAVHGIYAICYLSRQRVDVISSSEKVAAALGITQTHAAKVLKGLATAGVVSSVRGRNGGYALTKKMEEISVVEVLDALNPSEDESRLRAESCRRDKARLCTAHRGLLRLEDRMRSALARETLEGLAGSVCTDEDALASVRLACRSTGDLEAVAAS
jgi:Rrf2 family protein